MPLILQWAAFVLIGAAIGLGIFHLPPLFRYAAIALVLLAPVLYVLSFNINWPALLRRRKD